METTEQKARNLLERIGIEGAQEMSAGNIVELANLINKADRTPDLTMAIQPDMGASLLADGYTVYPGDVYHCYKVTK